MPEDLINVTRLIPVGHGRPSLDESSFHLEMEYDFELGTQKQKDFHFYCSEPFTSLQLFLLSGGKKIIVKYKAKRQHLLPAWFCCSGSRSN